jgi:hypothetical protein
VDRGVDGRDLKDVGHPKLPAPEWTVTSVSLGSRVRTDISAVRRVEAGQSLAMSDFD